MKKRRALELAGSRTLTSEQDHCNAPASEPGRQSPEIVENGREKNRRAAPPVPAVTTLTFPSSPRSKEAVLALSYPLSPTSIEGVVSYGKN